MDSRSATASGPANESVRPLNVPGPRLSSMESVRQWKGNIEKSVKSK
jgi:hypothetical protein